MRKKIYSLFALLMLTASAFAQLGVNVTDSLSDPTMEGVANWSNVGFKDNHKNTAYPLFNGYFIEAWTKSAADAETYLGSVSLTDTLRNLPNGSYLFTTAVMACQQSGNLEFVSDAFMFANDETVAVSTANNVPERFYVMTTVTDGQLVVGYRTVETDANWIAVDNARLYYYKDAVDKDCAISYLTLQDAYEQAVVYPDTLPMQQTVLTALKETVASAATLLSEGTAGKDVIDAAVEAIEAAVAAADASRASYDNLNKAIADALAVVEEYAEVPEVIDELAERAGVGEEVKAITLSAMRGEIDFKESFTRRCKLLKGLDVSVMRDIAENLPFTEGVDRLMYVLKKYGYKIAILSGGFTFFGEYLQRKFGIDYVYANDLEIDDNGKLTGKYRGEVVDGKRKAELLRLIAQVEKVDLEQTIAVGDGANDLPMLSLAGLGIAFHAKPRVVANAKQSINTIGLDGVLYFLGFKDSYLDV